ncbi:MAG: hypothetical protein JJ975_07020 [Bacteroidia bacterium]|nr:hypothetical protein [Bacteroidia bacterium]
MKAQRVRVFQVVLLVVILLLNGPRLLRNRKKNKLEKHIKEYYASKEGKQYEVLSLNVLDYQEIPRGYKVEYYIQLNDGLAGRIFDIKLTSSGEVLKPVRYDNQ